MPLFSANLGFLWTNHDLSDAVRAAATAGFDAVECHWPYDTKPEVLSRALQETGRTLLSLNTRRGNVLQSEFGLTALPGRTVEARDAIDEALAYASATNAEAVHVMAGQSKDKRAEAVFCESLNYACHAAKDRMILIEPLNVFDVPGYFLTTMAQARRIIEIVGAPNLKVMFDCYHVARMGDCVLTTLQMHLPIIGHIQFAGVPYRGAPDQGCLDYAKIFDWLDQSGWQKPLGAEYLPGGKTETSLSWMHTLGSRGTDS